MPRLNLSKRLQPAKKAWNIFTRKLHSKLYKLNRSKSIKKPTKRLNTTNKAIPWLALAFQPHLKRKKQTIQSTRILRCYHRHHHHHHQKRPPSVYIDQLFMEPLASAVKEPLHPPPGGAVATGKGKAKERSSPITEARLPYPVADGVPGTSKLIVEGEDKIPAADEMWESLGLASPLMHGINERAEEFITRIRAEMQLQETMARRL